MPEWIVLSKALAMSRIIAPTEVLLLRPLEMYLETLRIWCEVECLGLKPNCSGIMFFLLMCVVNLWMVTCSAILLNDGKREIDLKLAGLDESSPGLRIGMKPFSSFWESSVI